MHCCYEVTDAASCHVKRSRCLALRQHLPALPSALPGKVRKSSQKDRASAPRMFKTRYPGTTRHAPAIMCPASIERLERVCLRRLQHRKGGCRASSRYRSQSSGRSVVWQQGRTMKKLLPPFITQITGRAYQHPSRADPPFRAASAALDACSSGAASSPPRSAPCRRRARRLYPGPPLPLHSPQSMDAAALPRP